MSKGMVARILICISVFGLCLYSYLDQQNEVTRLRLQIPVVAKEVKDLKEEDVRLQFEIDLFESPQHLMELIAHHEYSHLKHPLMKQIMQVSEGIALQLPVGEKGESVSHNLKPTLAMGARP
jgi:hypothetical protein